MHRLTHSLATAGCSSTRAVRFAASSWRSTAATAVSPRPLLATASRRRNIHVRVPLPYKIEDGMGDFLPPAALKVIAEDYQQGLLDRLNEQIKGTKFENLSVAQIVISTAPHESQTLAFNYASLALNNSFFLHHLKPPTARAPNHESALTGKLLSHERTHRLAGAITAQLGSLADLKTYVAAAAQGMNSGGGAGGFVWLVTDALGRLGVVATYGAGTLLVAERRQSLLAWDGTELGGVYQPATPPPPPSGRTQHAAPAQARALSTSARASGSVRPTNVWSDPPLAPSDAGAVAGSDGTYGASEAPAALDALGKTLYPLFCVSVHEHAWMAAGYGVWGMETYLERFWTCLNWVAVREAYARYAVRK
ncbi:hypothetical protein EDB92DRAFT_1879859 [Lactarius akahatsu]|uniref:Manganese superoxide dismutase n=1 Tax=Lactarius akahatsu TaxID=416441 RepID=A0AAD4LA77_9AGAM|nr:hypothetical protein EDB92DRAFT_1912783 [Lactarius akahatsu]KAH8986342.1 hypothetical protein EDB92DRAFT_1879859 [Lactarius akahatsu]